MVAHTYNPCIWEAERPALVYSEFKANVNYIVRLCFKIE